MTQKPSVKKQFIAGARCPKCNELDVLVFYREEENPVRECVECGYLEVLSEQTEKEQQKAAQLINIKEL